ncbi:MAG: DUF3007 family protein [Spirulinaceae cyanobacterium RM2_2_10]|nr:DUF3007 family protein [Spirulinaceae cyanobacterium SM2_1_0]NJO19250.1 DUF3007 family protein [Spirulinaceae cyanobacterium RM2_2_10]
MRRIDAIAIVFGLFLAGGASYLLLRVGGLDSLDAGVWSQLLLVGVVIAWLGTYLFRVSTQTMTYNQQLKDYEEAVLQKRLDAMSPEELAELQAEIERESQPTSDPEA